LLDHESRDAFFIAFVNCLAEAAANAANDKYGEGFRQVFMDLFIALKKRSFGDNAVISSRRQA
jgi:hypothetical protein